MTTLKLLDQLLHVIYYISKEAYITAQILLCQ